MNLKNSKGFTLIELMIVVAIIAILAAIALPAYQNYIKRSKVTEGVVAADACKSSVVEYVASMNKMPLTTVAAGCGNAKTSQYVARLTYTAGTGAIETKCQNVGTGVDTLIYQLKPNSVASAVSGQLTGWTCTGSTVRQELLPASCR
jgi:type IV pilus assembly protein PilA